MTRHARTGLGRASHSSHVLLIVLSVTVLLGPMVVRAHDAPASPVAPDTGDPQELLRYVPATLPALEEPDQAIVAYADIATQLAAVGVVPPDGPEDDGVDRWVAAITGLALPTTALSYLRLWREDYGFDLLQADQPLEISLAPIDLTLYRGRFDQAAVTSALGQLGYMSHEVGGTTVFAIRGDYEVDLGAPTRYARATMNYGAVLDADTLVFASAQSIMEAVLDVESGRTPSLAERDDIVALLPHAPADLVSAQLVPGLLLVGGPGDPARGPLVRPGATPEVGAIATELAERDQIPPAAVALLGMTAGGPLKTRDATVPLPPDTPNARAVIALLMFSPAAAEQTAPIVEERLASGSPITIDQPFAELFPERTVRVVPGEPVVLIDLSLGKETPQNILQRLLRNRDLGFIAWW